MTAGSRLGRESGDVWKVGPCKKGRQAMNSKREVRKTITTTLLAITLVTALLGVAGTGHAGPTGKYRNSVLFKGKAWYVNGSTERFSHRDPDAWIKVRRTRIDINITSHADGEKSRVRLYLDRRVTNGSRQNVRVDRGSVSVKDLYTGQPLAWGGTFSDAEFKIWKSSNQWRIKEKDKLHITGISGVGIYQGTHADIKKMRARK